MNGAPDINLGSIFYTVEAKFEKLEEQLRDYEERADKAVKVTFFADDESLRALNEAIQAAIQPIRITLDTSYAEQQLASLGAGGGGSGGVVPMAAAAGAGSTLGGTMVSDAAIVMAGSGGGSMKSAARLKQDQEIAEMLGLTAPASSMAAGVSPSYAAAVGASEAAVAGSGIMGDIAMSDWGRGGTTAPYNTPFGGPVPMPPAPFGVSPEIAALQARSAAPVVAEASEAAEAAAMSDVEMIAAANAGRTAAAPRASGRGGGRVRGMAAIYLAIKGLEGADTALEDRSSQFEDMNSSGDPDQFLKSEIGRLKHEKSLFLGLPSLIRDAGEYLSGGRTSSEEIEEDERVLKQDQAIRKRGAAIARYGAEEERLGLFGGGELGGLESRAREMEASDKPSAIYQKINDDLDKELHAIDEHAKKLKELGEKTGQGAQAARQAADYQTQASAFARRIHDAATQHEDAVRDQQYSRLLASDEMTTAGEEDLAGDHTGADRDRIAARLHARQAAIAINDPLRQERLDSAQRQADLETGQATRRANLREIERRSLPDSIDEERLRAEGHDEAAHILHLRHETERDVSRARILYGADSREARDTGELGMLRLETERQRLNKGMHSVQVDPFFTYLGGSGGDNPFKHIDDAENFLKRELGIGKPGVDHGHPDDKTHGHSSHGGGGMDRIHAANERKINLLEQAVNYLSRGFSAIAG